MSCKFVVGYDGSDASRRALDFAIERAKSQDATIVIAHILEWSAFSFLTPTELEERHMRRREELGRAETALIAPIVQELSDSGVQIETSVKYGQIADTLCAIATETGGDQLFIGRNGNSSSVASRVFGSVAGTLAQVAPVPCTIVP